MNQSERLRIRIVFGGIVLVALILCARLYNTQVIDGKKYVAKAGAQYARPSSSVFGRGTIYFESKDGTRIAGATVESGNLVYVNPKHLIDANQAYEAIKEYIKLDKDNFLKSASDRKDTYFELAHRVPDELAAKIRGLNIKGVNTLPESWRSYPGGVMASQTLGIIGEDQSTTTILGKYGLERSYQSVLLRSGVNGSASIFAQLFAGVRDAFAGDDDQGNIVTTIEPTVQNYLEKILADTEKTWHPDEIGGIIVDPHTGAIIAMSSLPTFNGNETRSVKNAALFSNPLVEHIYEMGSIMKPLTVAIGLDTKAINTNWTYNDTGTMTLNSKTIGNYDGRARGITDVQTILSQSLNVGAANIGLKVGNNKMAEYFDYFGLGAKTGIDMPNEATGLIKNLRSGKEIDIATASYGQGVAISPIAMARALAVLANGGYMITPHLVKEIDYENGTKKILDYPKSGPVLETKTVHDVTAMLVEVVDEALKKGAIKNEHYTVAAKTGTAQIPDHVNGGYYKDKYLHSFFGYFPAYNPQFLVFLYQTHPKGAQFASETLTDPFDNLSKFLLNYFNVAPDR